MTTTSASVIIGNPSAPCSGQGVCEMKASHVDSALAFNVNLSSKGSTLTVNIPTDSLATLQSIRPDIYSNLTSENPVFNFDKGALPFYLDFYITQKVFQNSNYLWLDGNTACTVNKQDDGSIDLDFPQVNMVTNGKYGSTGSFDGKTLTSGNWQIGVDVYNNLIFMRPDTNTMFVFGSNGNINCNRYSVALSGYVPTIPTSANLNQLIGTWDFGTDDDGNLWISNGVNNVVFTVNNIGFVLDRVNINTEIVKNLPDSQLDPTAGAYQTGSWAIQQDTNGNLCFYNPTFSYFFTTDGNIYIGQTINVVTKAPLGG